MSALRVCVIVIAAITACAACGGRPAPPGALSPAGPRLAPPPSVDASVRGAVYLTAVAEHIQPPWAQFLEDCRLRLPKAHPLNAPGLAATAELAIARDGKIASARIAHGSGSGEFDSAVFGVLADAAPLPRPPTELESDDDLVHLQWLFARDRRQAGSATAQVAQVELPLLGVVERWLGQGALARAALRVARAPASDPDRAPAVERIMIAVLREGLASSNGRVRLGAAEAVGRARVAALGADIHRLVLPSPDADVRLAAIAAAAALRDPAAIPVLETEYLAELASQPAIALAKTAALVVLGRADDAAAAARNALARGPDPGALAVLALVPVPELAEKLPGWFSLGNARVRAGVCSALPAGARDAASALIARGLRDADATVRAVCVDAALRLGREPPDLAPALVLRLRELVRDRDRAVRARAVVTLGLLDPRRRPRVIDDAAPEVRIAAVTGASEAELRVLGGDRDPDVRAAAIGRLAEGSAEPIARAAADVAPQVRRAAVSALTDDDTLARLARDDAPDVATAAEIQLAERRGRTAATGPYLARIVGAPPGSPERVRIALAWLLAR